MKNKPKTAKKKILDVPLCKGLCNYHIFALGASKCSMCGWDRYK